MTDLEILADIVNDLLLVLEGLKPAMGARRDLYEMLAIAKKRLDRLRGVDLYTTSAGAVGVEPGLPWPPAA
jgi:hypothetical protein